MSNLVKKVQNTIFQENLFDRGSKIILGISGGPDSSAMLDIFSRLKLKYGLELISAHVNYGLRKKDSNRDEKFVRDLAKKYSLKIFVSHPPRTPRWKVPARKIKSSENKLREIRYEFFEKLREKFNFDYIAVGHSLDDQVETYLMRILRGAGLQGLSAMRYKNNRIIRPLLNIHKKEILKYLEKNNLAYRIDKTNLESYFFRNKIRNQLLPYLEKKFNPKIKETIFNATESIREDYDLIGGISQEEFKKNKNLSIKKLLGLHPAIQKRILLLALREIKGDDREIESSHIKEVLKIIKSEKSKPQIVLFKGLETRRKGDKIIITKKD